MRYGRLCLCLSAGSIRAAGMCIALAERYSNRFLDYKQLTALELQGGRVALSALTKLHLDGEPTLLENAMSYTDGAVDPMSTIDYHRTTN